MRHVALSALSLLAFGAASPIASAIVPVIPTAGVDVDGQHFDVPVTQATDGTWEVGGDTGWTKNVPGEYFISLTGAIDPDPQIDFGFSVTDFGAPSTFTFSFSNPIALAGGPNIVYASISGGLNDTTNNGAFITPALADMDGDGNPELQVNTVGLPTTNMGVDVGGSMTLPAGGPPGTQTYGPFNSAVQFGPPGPWTSLDSTVSFHASGGGDIFSAVGHAEINVPEPASLGLLAIAGLMGMRRTRRRSHAA